LSRPASAFGVIGLPLFQSAHGRPGASGVLMGDRISRIDGVPFWK
jgi:hypothetical protein